ncbi:deazapurine DNA modification protein DpdA family protein [Coleofasciculus sp. F4-SAH-05]|uniref:deazapurine DNA modification protein DpdA family protein n=1 Tax=Coleofasciculus sp. F4-SAH-05 TaxID=3069525 RepID=UPI004064099C
MNNTADNDNVQNRLAIAGRFCTKSQQAEKPLFFIGSSPSMAAKIIAPDYPAAGVMVSANALRSRKSDFAVGNWILDSGAFTEVARHGAYRSGSQSYYEQICRWAACGNLLAAVAQDWMCEPFVLQRTGLSVSKHRELTINRYDDLLDLNPPVRIMPVIQGYQSSEYLQHLVDYGDRLTPGAWVGVGSVCRRNGKPDEIANILRTIKLVRPDLKLHGFGLKATALESPEVRSLLFSCDSMAWSYSLRFSGVDDSVQNRSQVDMAHKYQVGVADRIAGAYHRPIPRTAGAGNGQGRKSKWNSGKTIAIRVPEKFAPKLLDLARRWDTEPDPEDK